ncbi:allophanate hydrolase [Microbulbifer sp. OS29]|uniref:Allophanate hydrolase n=1 Tax=Microbulbifer okhotskensis TaxID=2926617 RepID=A0A9X2ETF8_9GAMM|nr:allophanate hydrolase [Microbulbifer okhotskensis]MCO1335238.1 allophanate hydrolase [Microbulbifer okhotskensis]
MTYDLTLNQLKKTYQQGITTPRELINELLDQAQQQAGYNAWIKLLTIEQLQPFFDNLDTVQPKDLPLYGVPFAIKDNIDLAGVATTAACPDFSYIPSDSAFVVEALIRAGAIPLGKTNLDQFATGLVGVRSPYGQVKNAFNQDYISGGSSAGSAIATALGQVSFALGTDTAGSGRVPAALNNLIGHKPTRGLLSNTGVVPACKSLDCVSIFSLNCQDAASILEVAARFDANDSYSRTNPHYNRLHYFQKNRITNNASFTFGVPSDLDFQEDKHAQMLFNRAIEYLKALGGTAVNFNFEPFKKAAKLLYEGPWIAERWIATQNVKPGSMLEVIRTIIASAESKTAVDAFKGQYRLKALKRICDESLGNFDFVITPTLPTPYTREQLAEQPIKRNSILGTYTNFMNLLDYSATAVPVGFLNSGVSWGVTLFSEKYSDMALLSCADGLHRCFELPLGATGIHQHQTANQAEPFYQLAPPNKQVNVVVSGGHLEGQPLNWQLTEREAKLIKKTRTSGQYQLFALPDGKRPAMMRNEVDHGQAIEVEVWQLPAKYFGSLVAAIPAPLGIGKVELADGSWETGFICEASGIKGATNITHFASWRAWLKHLSR